MIFLKAIYLLFKLYFYDLIGMIWNNDWAQNTKETINTKVFKYACKIRTYNDDDFQRKFIIPMFGLLIGIIILELSILNKLLAKENLYITLELSKLLFFLVYAIMWGTISRKELKRRFIDFGKMTLWTSLIIFVAVFVIYFFMASFLSYYYSLKVTPETFVSNFIKSNAISTILYGVILAFLILLITFAVIPYIISKIIESIIRRIIEITIDKYPTDPLKPISTFISILFSIEMIVTIISIFRK